MAMNNPQQSKWLREAPLAHIVLVLCTVTASIGALGLQVEVCRLGCAAEDSSKWHPDLYFPGRMEAISWSLSHLEYPRVPSYQRKIQATKLDFPGAGEKKKVQGM